EADVRQQLANMEIARHNWTKAGEWLDQSLKAARDAHDNKAEAQVLYQLSNMEEAQNNWKKAVAYRSQQASVLQDYYAEHKDTASDLSVAYGGLAWGEVLSGDFENAVNDAQAGLKLDSEQRWINVNLAHGLLFSGRVDEARALYLRLKTTPRTAKDKD